MSAPETNEEASNTATQLFADGYFCAESALLAIAKNQGLDSPLLPKMATGFCSGMARTCGTCGALTGAMMGGSLALGRSQTGESVEPCYTAIQQLIQGFEDRFGSRDCQTLLDGCDLNTPAGQAMFKQQQLGQRCREITGKTTELAINVIARSKATDQGA